MTVLSDLPRIEVYVKVNGKIAPEYEAPEEESEECELDGHSPSHCCYIESISGANFSVHVMLTNELKFQNRKDAIAAYLYIDGIHIDGQFERKNCIQYDSPQELIFEYSYAPSRRRSELIRRKFTFSPVSSVEDVTQSRIKKDKMLVKSLGVIMVHIEMGKEGRQGVYSVPKVPTPRGFSISEKAMKGKEISHGVSFGCEETSKVPFATGIVSKKRIYTFIFKYRSLDSLKREMIIPPSPLPSPSIGDLEGLAEDEIRRLATKMLRIEQVVGAKGIVKRERDEHSHDTLNTAGRPLKKIKLANGKEAFDLTDD